MNALAAVVLAISLALIGAPAAAEVNASWSFAAEPTGVPDISFEKGDGATVSLGELRGRVILLNLWATWCVPCRVEMPALDRLQRRLGGAEFEVVALSIDKGGAAVVQGFFREVKVDSLTVYLDPSLKASFSLKAVGLPTSILIDGEGREIARVVGPAEWDDPAVAGPIENLIASQRANKSGS